MMKPKLLIRTKSVDRLHSGLFFVWGTDEDHVHYSGLNLDSNQVETFESYYCTLDGSDTTPISPNLVDGRKLRLLLNEVVTNCSDLIAATTAKKMLNEIEGPGEQGSTPAT